MRELSFILVPINGTSGTLLIRQTVSKWGYQRVNTEQVHCPLTGYKWKAHGLTVTILVHVGCQKQIGFAVPIWICLNAGDNFLFSSKSIVPNARIKRPSIADENEFGNKNKMSQEFDFYRVQWRRFNELRKFILEKNGWWILKAHFSIFSWNLRWLVVWEFHCADTSSCPIVLTLVVESPCVFANRLAKVVAPWCGSKQNWLEKYSSKRE